MYGLPVLSPPFRFVYRPGEATNETLHIHISTPDNDRPPSLSLLALASFLRIESKFRTIIHSTLPLQQPSAGLLPCGIFIIGLWQSFTTFGSFCNQRAVLLRSFLHSSDMVTIGVLPVVTAAAQRPLSGMATACKQKNRRKQPQNNPDCTNPECCPELVPEL